VILSSKKQENSVTDNELFVDLENVRSRVLGTSIIGSHNLKSQYNLETLRF
jgi:hypothetical protein